MTSPDEPQDSQEDSQPQEAAAAPEAAASQDADQPQEAAAAPQGAAAAVGRWPEVLRRHWLWLAVSAAVVLAVVAAVTIPGSSSGFAPTASSQQLTSGGTAGHSAPAAAAPAPATAASPAAVASPGTVPGMAPLPHKLAVTLASWDAGRGGVALAVLLKDVGNTTQSAGLKLYDAMKIACSTVSTAVPAAQGSPPIPDATMQKRYSQAQATLAKAAADCRAGISAQANGEETVQTEEIPAILHRSESEFAAGSKELYLATAQIRALNNK
jgi:hypothetical protein